MSGPAYSALELLSRLVAFDTTSHKSNLPLIRFVEDFLAQHGIASDLVVSHDAGKANLFATIGPKDKPGVALSGHTDVVPVMDQNWDGDPFVVRAAGGRLHGRGTCDMKGFIACALAAVPDFASRRLAVPIHLAFSYDEETGCTGVRPMLAEFGTRFVLPRMAIVGEPTSMTVVDAHKGPVRWHIDVVGRAAHSSMAPLGVNAITTAMSLIAELSRIETDLKRQSVNDRFDPPYSTLQVTEIAGGAAANIVPALCQFGFEVRALPGLETSEIENSLRNFAMEHCLPGMQAVAPEASITVSQINSVPAYSADRESDAIPIVLKLAEQNDTNAVSYATEAGLFQGAGVPAVVCGPGDIAQAHTANEWVSEEQIVKCSHFLGRLADWAETG